MTNTDPVDPQRADAGHLPSAGRRRSRQRDLLLAYLEQEPVFRTAQEIHSGLREQGHEVGLATVYRTLQLLADGEEVDTLRGPSGEQSYRLCSSSGHHHHLICGRCGAVLEFDDQPVMAWVEQLCARSGFTPDRHILEVVGTCRDCTL